MAERRVAPYAGAWIEIALREQAERKKASHPTRVRGLKFNVIIHYKHSVLSHPTRVRGLKFQPEEITENGGESHPTRVRGLKFSYGNGRRSTKNVAPYAGAWIEISLLLMDGS